MEDRERIGIAVAAALVVHAVLFAVVPGIEERPTPEFTPPLYIALDPVNQENVPDESPEPPPEVVQRSQPEPSPQPRPELQLESERQLQREAQSAQPQQAQPQQTSPQQASPQAQRPTEPQLPTERVPASEAPSVDGSQREAQPRLPAEPAPPPSPPRERSFDPANVATSTSVNAEIQASQIEEITRLQEEYLADLAAWQDLQSASSVETNGGDTDTPQSDPALSSFQDALSRAIDGIRQAENVVTATSQRQSTGADPESDSPGDEPSGRVTIGEGGGRRALVAGDPPDLSGVSLPPGFPPEYLVTVSFDVGSDGWVQRARLKNGTPAPQLDEILRETIESWRFEPAQGAGVVSGTVTIVVTAASDETAR